MKKLFTILVLALFAFGLMTPAFADEPASDGYEILGGGGQKGLTPGTLIVPVRYGLWGTTATRIDPSLASGDAVVWDTNSADGLTISSCAIDRGTTGSFAGVLVSTIQTADNAILRRNSRNWGKMAIKGYCLAKVDSTGETAGRNLFVNGATLPGSLATEADTTFALSQDIGVLLKAPDATDGLAPVWLN